MVSLRRLYGLIISATIIISIVSLLATMGSVGFARNASASLFSNFWPQVLDAVDHIYIASLKLSQVDERQSLKSVLKSAANENNTVIISIMNGAWSGPDLLFDLFIESFVIGEGTKELLDHLVVVTLDQQAFNKCKKVHKYCYAHSTQGHDFHGDAFYMSPSYIKLVWTRLNFMTIVLEMGYDILFTDTDILWLKNPFPLFDNKGDIQVSSEHHIGKPYDLRNQPNVGFLYVRSNKNSIEFFKFWYEKRNEYPNFRLQGVLNIIKFDTSLSVGIKIRFLNTNYLAGLCTHVDLSLAYTLHANCCVGLNNKLRTLKFIFRDWQFIISSPVDQRGNVSKVLQQNHHYKCRYMSRSRRTSTSQGAKIYRKETSLLQNPATSTLVSTITT